MSTLYLDIRHPWARCPLPLNGMYLTSPSLWMDSVHYRAFFEAQNWRVHPHIQLKDLCCCGPLHFYLIFFRFGLDFNQVSLFGLDLPWTPLSFIFFFMEVVEALNWTSDALLYEICSLQWLFITLSNMDVNCIKPGNIWCIVWGWTFEKSWFVLYDLLSVCLEDSWVTAQLFACTQIT